jgi:hypothetical protein
MHNRRIALLAAVLSFLSTGVSASTLITWEFSGVISGTTTGFHLDQLYPVGTPFSLDVTFDSATSRISRPPGPFGLYHAITTSSFQLGNTTTTTAGGYIAVNCDAIFGCSSGGPGQPPSPYVEFLMFPLGPPLNPNVPSSGVSRLLTYDSDPSVLAGGLPTTLPVGIGNLSIGLGGDPVSPSPSLQGEIQSVRSIDDVAVVPEPGSFLLLATGLVALRGRKRVRRYHRL